MPAFTGPIFVPCVSTLRASFFIFQSSRLKDQRCRRDLNLYSTELMYQNNLRISPQEHGALLEMENNLRKKFLVGLLNLTSQMKVT